MVLIIDSLPMVARVLTPMARDRAKASTTLPSAPLCSAMPTGPGSNGAGTVSANGAAPECDVEETQAVRPEQDDPVGRGPLGQPVFQHAARRADLAVTRREHDRVTHARRGRVVDHVFHRVRRAPG